jgi:hypothetical protein
MANIDHRRRDFDWRGFFIDKAQRSKPAKELSGQAGLTLDFTVNSHYLRASDSGLEDN